MLQNVRADVIATCGLGGVEWVECIKYIRQVSGYYLAVIVVYVVHR